MPVIVFGYCYGRIFHVIRRQSKVLAGHSRCGQDISMATTSRDPRNTEQVQQQATGTPGSKLSRRELNILQTMISVIVCFLICWSVADIADFLQRTEVSMSKTYQSVTHFGRVTFLILLRVSATVTLVPRSVVDFQHKPHDAPLNVLFTQSA